MEQNSRKTEPHNRGNGVMKKAQMQLNGQSFHQIVLGQLHVYTPKAGGIFAHTSHLILKISTNKNTTLNAKQKTLKFLEGIGKNPNDITFLW